MYFADKPQEICGQAARNLLLYKQSVASAVSREHNKTAKEAQDIGKQLSNDFAFSTRPGDAGSSPTYGNHTALATVLPKQQRVFSADASLLQQ